MDGGKLQSSSRGRQMKLAFTPKLKLDTRGFCYGFTAPEDKETNKPEKGKGGAVLPLVLELCCKTDMEKYF
ncbi:hypothetical protein ILYODFUR_009652 [Ilyodon furcidens]|uniref:Uncharacterized protein n=1 Tax=Ilyodon furcidens TaxID=33524 RepID=A0ABV0VCL3_9TELE